MTCHRRESFGRPLEDICQALRQIAEANDDVRILFVRHPNPEAGMVASRLLAATPRLELAVPLSYPDSVEAMNAAYAILTDSGGIQEEAAFLGRPVLVLRQRTERTEGLRAGVARVIGTQTEAIVTETQRLLDDAGLHRRMSRPVTIYGDGEAAARICGWLRRWAGISDEAPPDFPMSAGDRKAGPATRHV